MIVYAAWAAVVAIGAAVDVAWLVSPRARRWLNGERDEGH